MDTEHPVEPDLMARMEPVRLLAAYEEVSPMPVRPEFVEGRASLALSPPDFQHCDTVADLFFQLHSAGVPHSGTGNAFRFTDRAGATTALLIPDFYAMRRKPTRTDECHYATYPGWYPSDLLALVGEVTSTNHEMDTGPKLRTYAAAEIPVYVLINHHSQTAHCYTDPTRTHYATDTQVTLGDPLPLPAPYPTLDTTPFLSD